MFLVVSKWQAKPGKEEEFERVGMEMRAVLRGLPGITFAESFQSGSITTVVHCYLDEPTYHSIMDNEDSGFHKAAKEYNLEGVAEWLGSDRGETKPYAGTPMPTVASV
jgi:heme-degrading monooxygenase HmoA